MRNILIVAGVSVIAFGAVWYFLLRPQAIPPQPATEQVIEEEKDTKSAPEVETKPAPTPEPVPKPSAAPASPEPREYIVNIYSYTDWQPTDLTIYVGDTITFINRDSELHWPGADPHPTHSSLPAFDALGGISEGQSYSHTFQTPGIFSHHDHLLDEPPTIGTITVLPRE